MRKQPLISGTFTPPDDLQPAIDALTELGRAWLLKRCEGREIMSDDVGLACDFERGNLRDE